MHIHMCREGEGRGGLHMYMCIYVCTHIYVYAYIFIHPNPVLFSLYVFAVIHRGEALVSQETGGLPCPLQPLHRPKCTSAFSGFLDSFPGSICLLLKKHLWMHRSPSCVPAGTQALQHSSFKLLLLHFPKHTNLMNFRMFFTTVHHLP